MPTAEARASLKLRNSLMSQGAMQQVIECPKCRQPRPAASFLARRGHRLHCLPGRPKAKCHVCRSQQSAKAAITCRLRAAATGSYWDQAAQQRALRVLELLATPKKERRNFSGTQTVQPASPAAFRSSRRVRHYKVYMMTVAGLKRRGPKPPAGISLSELRYRYREFIAGRISREEFEQPPVEQVANG